MSFKTKPVNTQTLGEYLIALRGHLGMSVAEICKLTKIPSKYLDWLEQGEYSKLPATVYVKGFLKTLARLYRVEDNQLRVLFDAEKSLSLEFSSGLSPRPLAVRKFVWSPRTFVVAGLAILLLGSLGYLYWQISSVRKPPYVEVWSPGEDGHVDASFVMLEGRTEAGASLYLNNQPVAVAADGNFREHLSLAPGTNILEIKAVGKLSKETVVTRQVVTPEKQIAGAFDEPTGTSSPAKEEEVVELQIQIGPRTATLSIEADGENVFSGTMLPGSTRRISGKYVRVSTSNAGSTRVMMNRQDLGVLGKDGEALRDVDFTE